MKQVKTLVAGMIMAMVMVVNPFDAKAGVEEATSIQCDEYVQGNLETSSQTQYYQFSTGNELSSYTMEAVGINHSVRVSIVDAMEKQIGTCYVGKNGGNYTVKLQSNQIYYVKVKASFKNTDYSFKITSQKDDADTLETAGEINVGESLISDICEKNDEDWFKINTGADTCSYKLESAALDHSVVVGIYDPNGKKVISSTVSTRGKEFVVKLNPNSSYYIKINVNNKYSSPVGYSLNLTSDPDEADEKNNARMVNVLDGIESDICMKDDTDWFAFQNDTDALYDFTVTGIDHSVSMIVCDENETALLKMPYAGSSGKTRSVFLNAGTKYYIKVNASSSAKYSIIATKQEIEVEQVNIKSLSAKNRKIVLVIQKGSGVDGYEIQYATNKQMKNVTKKNGKSISYTFTGKKKTKYYVRVRSYKKVLGKYIYSDWSDVKTVKVKNK